MSNFATLPQKVGLPQELQVNEIDPCMPHDAKSNSIRVYASNNQSVLGAFATGATAVAAGVQMADIPFPQTEITFDLPCAQSRDTFIDTRLSTINFRAVVTVTTAGTTKDTQATLRSSAYAYFDSMRVTGQSGQILESINEYGLLADSLIQGQMSNSDREGLFNYGFKSNYGLSSTTAGINVFTNTGHDFKNLSGTLTTGDALSSNYSLPLLSSVIGTLNDRFFPIGLTRKLLLTLTTAPVLPFNIVIAPTTGVDLS